MKSSYKIKIPEYGKDYITPSGVIIRLVRINSAKKKSNSNIIMLNKSTNEEFTIKTDLFITLNAKIYEDTKN